MRMLCQENASAWGIEGKSAGETYVESQTLIVRSEEPETIDDPSGEKATELTMPLCAFVFSVLRSSVAAQESRRRQFWAR